MAFFDLSHMRVYVQKYLQKKNIVKTIKYTSI